MKSLEDMRNEVEVFENAKGWYDQPVTFLERMMLLTTEVAEAVEAFRNWGTDDETEPGYFPDGSNYDGSRPKPEGVGSEFADIFIRLLGDCRRWGIDLEAEYERKMAYNMTRPFRHGGKRA